jgi:protein subunit release factor A
MKDTDLIIDTWTYGNRFVVRVTHIPTGFYGESAGDLPLQKNKEAAMTELRKKLKAKGRLIDGE